MSTTLTATRGLPASGKTTYARHLLEWTAPGELVRLNRDDIRVMIHGTSHHIHTTEQQVSTVQHGSVERMLRAGVSVIVDDTNLRAKNLRALAEPSDRCLLSSCREPLEESPSSYFCTERHQREWAETNALAGLAPVRNDPPPDPAGVTPAGDQVWMGWIRRRWGQRDGQPRSADARDAVAVLHLPRPGSN